MIWDRYVKTLWGKVWHRVLQLDGSWPTLLCRNKAVDDLMDRAETPPGSICLDCIRIERESTKTKD